jgi:hypothetical protein
MADNTIKGIETTGGSIKGGLGITTHPDTPKIPPNTPPPQPSPNSSTNNAPSQNGNKK